MENFTVPPFGGGAIAALTSKGFDAAMNGGTTIDVAGAPAKAYASFSVAVPSGVVIADVRVHAGDDAGLAVAVHIAGGDGGDGRRGR